jgi:pyruvate kinase
VLHILARGVKPGDKPWFKVNYDDFVNQIPRGSTILIDDGLVELKVSEKYSDHLECVVVNSGSLKNKKSVNVPNVHLNIPPLTERDIEYIHFAIEQDIDFIAHSFVRSKDDLLAIQSILDRHDSDIKLIAKIENQMGIDNLDDILEQAYGVMIARGDLGVELPAEEVPIVQKQIIRRCQELSKPVITATHMLESMIKSPRATRAEISDVANAILDGTDAVMLSGETAYGDFPVEATRTMSRIARRVEASRRPFANLNIQTKKTPVHRFLIQKTVIASMDLPIQAIVDATISGTSVRMISSYRTPVPIYAKCFSTRLMRELSLSYGVFASTIERVQNTDQMISSAIESLVEDRHLADDDLVVILAPTHGSKTGANFIEIASVAQCMNNQRKAMEIPDTY